MGYNTGDTYEEKIFDICQKKGITPVGSTRAGASANKADVEFVHLGITYKLEVKNKKQPDYGQRRIHYDAAQQTWDWAIQDTFSNFYNKYNVLGLIRRHFIPIWYQKMTLNAKGHWEHVKNKPTYDLLDLKSDQKNFDNPNNPIPIQALFNYYKIRNTYYIQIEGSGFYHLDSDIANLGTTQYDGTLTVRFRLKRHKRNPIHSCSFFAVLKQKSKPTLSVFNIETSKGQIFPAIK